MKTMFRLGFGAVAVTLSAVGGCVQIWGIEDAELYRPDAGAGARDGGGTTSSTTTASTTSSTGSGGSSCDDGKKNGDETGKDCGGGTCDPCPNGQGCIVGPDCQSSVCLGGTCVAAGCSDQIMNGAETDVDCGGPDCPACANTQMCLVHGDCQSGVCESNICTDFHIFSKRFIVQNSAAVASVAVDSAERIALALNLNGSINLIGNALDSAGTSDIALARLDPAGNHLWSMAYGDAQDTSVSTIAVDSSGEIVLTGSLAGFADFGGGMITSAGGCCPALSDVLVVKLDANNQFDWNKTFGNSSSQQGFGVAVDSGGNVLLTGNLQSTANFGGGTLTSAGQGDIYVAKLGPTGTHTWSYRFGDGQNQYGNRVVADAANNVIVSGVFQGTLNLGKGAMSSAGGMDAFVAKFDPGGTALWSYRYGAQADEQEPSIAVDPTGNTFVASSFQGTINFGCGPLTSQGSTDFVLIKIDPSGTCMWSKPFGDPSDQPKIIVAVDTLGNVLLTGAFAGTVDFGGGPLTSAGGTDVFVAKLDGNGNYLWSRSFGDAKNQGSAAITTMGPDKILIAGNFDGTLDFGGGPMASTSGTDVFLAKLLTP